MLISERTKLAVLIRNHPDALEAIVSLSEDFKKLRNPVLRALMVGRVTIAMASKVGKVQPEDFFRVLAPLGFEVDHTEQPQKETSVENKPKPKYLFDISPDLLVHFDVRAILKEGKDPLKSIQKKVKSLQPGEVLVLINDFEPVPLIKLLEKQGFKSYVDCRDADTYETYFYKEGNEKKQPVLGDKPGEEPVSIEDWEALLDHYKCNLSEIDVRHLEMPMPMMTILENLEVLPPEKALYVHHKRIPVFLLTELKDRSFDYRIREASEGEVYLLIFKHK